MDYTPEDWDELKLERAALLEYDANQNSLVADIQAGEEIAALKKKIRIYRQNQKPARQGRLV